MKLNLLPIFLVLFLTLLFVCAANAQTDNNSKENVKKSEKQEKDRPVKIKSKPRVELGSCSQSSGIVTLRVAFDKSAKVTNVEIATSSGCDSFDKKAIKAAKEIKFEPAIKNGEPTTVAKLVQYSYTKY